MLQGSSPSISFFATACKHAQSCLTFFATLWTAAHQASLSMAFPREEYYRGLLFPSPGTLPDPRTEPEYLVAPALASGFFTTVTGVHYKPLVQADQSLWLTLFLCQNSLVINLL